MTYDAVVNENAVIAGDGNSNKTQLKFGEDSDYETTWDETKTYTYKVDVVKTDGDNKVLDGAEFKLYDAKTGGNEIPLVKVSNGVYRFAKDGEQAVDTITTVNGQLEIKGFDANTIYWLEETKAPKATTSSPDASRSPSRTRISTRPSAAASGSPVVSTSSTTPAASCPPPAASALRSSTPGRCAGARRHRVPVPQAREVNGVLNR